MNLLAALAHWLTASGPYYKSQYDRDLRQLRRNFYATNSGVEIYDDGVVFYDASIVAA